MSHVASFATPPKMSGILSSSPHGEYARATYPTSSITDVYRTRCSREKEGLASCGLVLAAIPTSKLCTSCHFACVEAIGAGSVFPTHCNRFNRLKALCVRVEHFNLLHYFCVVGVHWLLWVPSRRQPKHVVRRGSGVGGVLRSSNKNHCQGHVDGSSTMSLKS